MDSQATPRQGHSPLFRVFTETEPATAVVDLGAADRYTADVVADTLIVVDERAGEQFEYSLPGDSRRTFMQNGILTIEVEE